MALVIKDRVLETCTGPGTGAVTLLGATSGYQPFSTAIGDANTTYYAIVDQSGLNWEVGLGTYTLAGNTLARTTVLASSNAGALVNFSAGTQNVFCDYPAGRAVYGDATNIIQAPSLNAEVYSTAAAVTAGTNAQGQGPLVSDYNIITTAAANPSGVTLPTATVGRRIIVVNKGLNPITVYPATNAYIDNAVINTPITIPVAGWMEFDASSTTQWYSSKNAMLPVTSGLATGILKNTTGTGVLSIAVAGTDYLSPTTPALVSETYSTTAAVTAGTNAQGQGALTTDFNVVTTAAANPSGVTLPTATVGRRIIINNRGANPIAVFPATGGTIDALAINTAFTIPVNSWAEFNASSATQWYSSAVAGAGAGTVTSVSVVSANGLAGTVATATTTPAITLSTTITGILKGNATAISAAVANTDYLTPTTPPIAGERFSAGAVTGGTDARNQGLMTTNQDLGVVTSAPNNPSGVTLPPCYTGRRVFILNRGVNSANVYPYLGGSEYIDGRAVGTPIFLAPNTWTVLNALDNSNWYSFNPGLYGYMLQPLALANWTQMNISAPATVINSGIGPVITDQFGTGPRVRGLYKLAPTPPYTITAMLSANAPAANSASFGLGFTDGTKIQMLANGYNSGPALRVLAFTSATVLSGDTVPSQLWNFATNAIWLQISDDNTNVTFRQSSDGINFNLVYTVAKASGFLGATGYTNVGFFLDVEGTPQAGQTQNCSLTLQSWRQT